MLNLLRFFKHFLIKINFTRTLSLTLYSILDKRSQVEKKSKKG